MTKLDFVKLLSELGFWSGYLRTGKRSNNMILEIPSNKTPFNLQQLAVHFIEGDLQFTLQLEKISNGMQTGTSYGVFELKSFGEPGDFQMELFFSFINGAFRKETGRPHQKTTEYIRDKNIQDILK